MEFVSMSPSALNVPLSTASFKSVVMLNGCTSAFPSLSNTISIVATTLPELKQNLFFATVVRFFVVIDLIILSPFLYEFPLVTVLQTWKNKYSFLFVSLFFSLEIDSRSLWDQHTSIATSRYATMSSEVQFWHVSICSIQHLGFLYTNVRPLRRQYFYYYSPVKNSKMYFWWEHAKEYIPKCYIWTAFRLGTILHSHERVTLQRII